MSESTFPFGAPTEPEPAPEEVADGESRKPLLLVGGLVGALVLGAGAFLLLGGEGGEDLSALAVTPRPATQAPAAAPQAVEVIPAASSDAVGRNPFKAQYIAPVVGGGGGTGETQQEGTTPATDATPAQQATIVRLSAPVAEEPAADEPASEKPAAPAVTAPPATTPPASTPAPVPPVATPSPEPDPVVVDDGMRYPVTLQSIDVTAPGDGAPAVQFGHSDEDFHVLVGKSFGRFQHLRVIGIVREDVRSGVLLQIGDGSPFYLAVNETVYVL